MLNICVHFYRYFLAHPEDSPQDQHVFSTYVSRSGYVSQATCITCNHALSCSYCNAKFSKEGKYL